MKRLIAALSAVEAEKRGLARIPAPFREFVPVPRFFRARRVQSPFFLTFVTLAAALVTYWKFGGEQ